MPIWHSPCGRIEQTHPELQGQKQGCIFLALFTQYQHVVLVRPKSERRNREREHELNPMGSKYGRDVVTNMRGGTKHKLIEIESYLPTVYLFASFEEIQSA